MHLSLNYSLTCTYITYKLPSFAGIVPSTPTLFVPRRSDGFGEAVSSPHVPTSGRFTFNEPGAQSNVGSNEVVPEQTLEMSNIEDNSKY